jgi:hypothetical protein
MKGIVLIKAHKDCMEYVAPTGNVGFSTIQFAGNPQEKQLLAVQTELAVGNEGK